MLTKFTYIYYIYNLNVDNKQKAKSLKRCEKKSDKISNKFITI